jgi:DnaJ family protein A protein 2
MSDYYNVLGISKGASVDEIKSAYKKLALKNHPDRGGDKDVFQKIQQAYEVLSDDKKRSDYDNPMGGNIFSQDPFFNQFHHQFNHSFDIKPVKKNDYHYTCNITLEEVFNGCVKKLKVERKYGCKTCFNKCNFCNGLGRLTKTIQLGPFRQTVETTCSSCSGSGKMFTKIESCVKCDISGIIKENSIFEIVIDKAVENGKLFIFKDWGEQPIRENEIAGSFVVTVNILKHEHFERVGLHLKYKVVLTLRESIVGKKILVPHFGEPIDLNTSGFGVINPKKEYIIYKKGLVNQSGDIGNLSIRFEIEYIDRSFNQDELVLLNETFDRINF